MGRPPVSTADPAITSSGPRPVRKAFTLIRTDSQPGLSALAHLFCEDSVRASVTWVTSPFSLESGDFGGDATADGGLAAAFFR